MLLREVEYARPSTVEDAIRLLGANDGARALAGGQTLLNVMKARAASPDVLVDLGKLEELRAIRVSGDTLELGAMATYTHIMASSEVDVARPVLAEVVAQIADVQVRNRGTIGGNVCSNDPTNHLPPLLAALGATFAIRGAGGERTVPADEFFLGVYMTAVGEGELLTKVSVPASAHAADGFASVTIGRDGTCIANAAASVSDPGVTLVLGCVDAVPVVLRPADASEEAVRAAVDGAGLDPPSDVHASSEYRRHLAGVCAVRAVAQAQARGR
jgi:carbon-monoxide dehydrogenase medium subunit